MVMAKSNQNQVEALSEISDIIVQISEEDLERLELLAEQITRFNQELGRRILEACSLLTQLNDDVELALERLEPDTEDEVEEDDEDDEALEAADAEMDEDEVDMEDEEDEEEERGKGRSRRRR
jgi:phosphopantothenoylcysteine synthetase/decarboxylase